MSHSTDSDSSAVSSTYHSDDGDVVSFMSDTYEFSISSTICQRNDLDDHSSGVSNTYSRDKIQSLESQVETESDSSSCSSTYQSDDGDVVSFMSKEYKKPDIAQPAKSYDHSSCVSSTHSRDKIQSLESPVETASLTKSMESDVAKRCVILEGFPLASQPETDIATFLATVLGVQHIQRIQRSTQLTESNTPNWILLCNSEQDARKCTGSTCFHHQGTSVLIRGRLCSKDEIPDELKALDPAQVESMVSIGKVKESMMSVAAGRREDGDAPGDDVGELEYLNHNLLEGQHDGMIRTRSDDSVSINPLQFNVDTGQQFLPNIHLGQGNQPFVDFGQGPYDHFGQAYQHDAHPVQGHQYKVQGYQLGANMPWQVPNTNLPAPPAPAYLGNSVSDRMPRQIIPNQPPSYIYQAQPNNKPCQSGFLHNAHQQPHRSVPFTSLMSYQSTSSGYITDQYEIPHSYCAPLLTAQYSEFDLKPPALGVVDTIEVHGCDVSSNGSDKYWYFFENGRRGGGEIEKFDVTEDNILIITFKDPSVAHKLVEEGKSKVGETEVIIKQHIPPPLYKNKILLEYPRAHLDQSSEELLYYIEARSQGILTNRETGSKPNVILLTFDHPVDTQKLQSACRLRPFNKRLVNVVEVPATRILHVQGVPNTVSTDTLQNYFETRKSGNKTNCEVTWVDDLEENGAYLVHFVDFHAVRNITQEKHTLRNHQLQVSLYHKCIGFSSSRLLKQPGIETSTITDVNSLIVRFLKKSPPMMSEINRKAKDHNMVLSINVEDKLCATRVQALVESDANWKENVERMCLSILDDTIAHHSLHVPIELRDKVQSMIAGIATDSTNVKCYTNKITVNIVGSKRQVSDMKKKIEVLLWTEAAKQKPIVTEQTTTDIKQMTVGEQQTKEVTQKKSVTDKVKPLVACLLLAMDFAEDVRKDYPEVKITVDSKANEVHIEGPEETVTDVRLKIQVISSAEIVEIRTISEQQAALLQKAVVKKEVISRLKENGIIAEWTTKQSSIEIISRTKSDAEETAKKISATVIERICPTGNNMLSLLSSESWESLQTHLMAVFPDRFIITNIQNENYLSIVGLDDVVDNVYETVSTFFAANVLEKTVVNVKRGVYRFIKRHLCKEVEKIAKDLKDFHVQITQRADESGFIVFGSEEGIRTCKLRLDELTSKVITRKEPLKKVGMAKLLKSEKGPIMINHVEQQERCTVEIETDDRRDVSSSTITKAEPVTTIVAVTNLAEGRKIYIRQGDITSVRVGAMVNAANKRLDRCGGLSKAIVDKGGITIQDECRKYIMTYGQLLDGAAVMLGPGNLPCDWIIHVVGPNWEGGNNKEKEYLREAAIRSMELAESKQCVSVAIPGLSTGIHGYPTDAATEVITTAVRDYFREKRDSVIKDVYFCDSNTNTINGFVKALKGVFDQGSVHVQPQQGGETQKGQVRPTSVSHSMPTGRDVVVVKGQISKQEVDVIVNSTNQTLQLKEAGAVSKSLLEVAGPELQSACSRLHPGGITPGSVVVTRGGKLQCKRVYHVFLPQFTSDAQAKKDIKDLVTNCLTSAAPHKISSMAFPAIGTGGLKYPRELVAACMFKAINDFWLRNPRFTKDVRIVLYEKDLETITAFEKEKGKLGQDGGSHQSMRPTSVSHSMPTGRDVVVVKGQISKQEAFEKEKGKLGQDGGSHQSMRPTSVSHSMPTGRDVVVVKGQISKQEVDVIVNSTNQTLQLEEAGAVSKSLLEVAGPELQSACSRLHPGGITPGSVVVTRGGKLQCKRVYHVFLPQFTSDAQAKKDIKDLVTNCLTSAAPHKISSMAFPAIGTGGLKYPRELVAACMFKAINDFWLRNPRFTKDVRIVLYEKDLETITAFEKEKGKLGQDGGSHQSMRPTSVSHSMPTGRDVVVVKGQISKQEVDVIVNSTNQTLQLEEAGAVSKSLLEVAGPELQSACSQLHPGGITPGSVVVTRGGKLQCKRVYHVFLPQFTSDAQAKKDIKDLVTNCLTSAAPHKISSMAFPAIGTGGLKYPRELVAACMFKAINDFWLRNPRFTKDVRIVLYEKDLETITAFEKEKGKLGQDGGSHQSMRPTSVSHSMPTGRDVVVVKGQISKQEVDVIVNSTNQTLQLEEAGAVSKSLLEVAGPELQSACSRLHPGGITPGSVVVTRGGKLQCKRVYHVFLPQFTSDAQAKKDIKDLVTNCLTSAAPHKISSMAFPAIGTGGLKYPRELVAACMFKAINDFWLRNPRFTKDVRIVLYEKDLETITAFEKEKGKLGQDGWSHQSMRPTSVSHSMPTGRDVVVVKGQISKQEVDVIVNSTNQTLQLKEAGAVSKSLLEVAGPELQSACSRLHPGGITPGSVVVTRGGKLQCKRVYHVFLPQFTSDAQAKKDIKDLVTNCLTSAAPHKISSMAFPAIGTGGLKYPRELVAACMFKAINDFWLRNPRFTKDVRIVLHEKDLETITAFEKEKGKLGQDGGSHQSTLKRFPRKPDLVLGSIVRFKADVIVNPTDYGLNLNRGRLSSSISEAAETALNSEAKRKYPNGVPQCGLAVTSAGGLGASEIYHVVIMNRYQVQDEQHLTNAITTCLEEADRSKHTSILFPTLGIGTPGYDTDLAAKAMYQAIDEFWTKHPGTTLTQIKIVIYELDDDVAKVFKQERIQFYQIQDSARKDRQLKGALKESAMHFEEPAYDIRSGVTFGNIQFTLLQGDLLQEQVDCIINNAHSQFDLNHDLINQALLQKFGDSVHSNDPQKVTDLENRGIAVTKVSGAPFNKIILFDGFHFDNDVTKVLKRCIKEADKIGCSSVALPALGQGPRGQVPDHRFLQYLYDTLKGLSNLKNVTEVHLVVFEKPMFQRFTTLLENLVETQGLKKRSLCKKAKAEIKKPFSTHDPIPKQITSRPRHMSVHMENGLEVSFFSDTQEGIQNAVQRLFDAYDKEFDSQSVLIEALKKLSDVKKLHMEAQQYGVAIEVNQRLGRIQVQGIKDDTATMLRRVYEMCLEHTDEENAEILGSVVQWYFMDMLGEELVKYDAETNKAIEKAYRENKESHVLEDTEGVKYIVDFGNLVEYSEDDLSTKCPVIRKDLIQAALFDPPPTWMNMGADNMKVNRVDPNSGEYQRVSAKFASTNKQIVKLERIQNKTLLKQYQAKKQLFDQRAMSVQCERELWHGTAADAIPSINKDGFNRSYCGKNAVMYGNGVYFAVNASYSTQDTYARPDPMGNKYIYLVDVLTGEYTKGGSGMRVPPPVNPADPSVLYDSVVDDVNNPSMFVIFNDTQAYPKYLITFK